ncbi:aldo/keto reductase [Pelagibius litoralis]|uniref:Aldo/keto reductase n=1 Tax=Pelagibius litoralis TaxID=374515 RepID=A0A967C307_9PROT|nr:aldo/keto reductase [Pelagibius litoralis]NIA67479.1 aldo/keto reductase [Pelagibius litoralis]
MKDMAQRRLGKTGLQVTEIGFGTAPLGNLYEKIDDKVAMQTLEAAWDGGLRFIDTAPFYGYGLAEQRVGEFLRNQPRDAFVLSTKIGRLIKPHDPAQEWPGVFRRALPFKPVFDYSYDGVMRSFEDSLQRMGLHRIDVLLVHDLDIDSIGSEEETEAHRRQLFAGAGGGGYAALDELRRNGDISGIGAGLNLWEVAESLIHEGDFDCFLIAGRYTLLEQEVLTSFLPLCAEKDIGIFLGGPYNSGILASGPVPGAMYNYEPASSEILERVGRIEAVCRAHGVPLASAALRFPLGHPCIAAIIPGARTADEVSRNLATFDHPIPAALWSDLKGEGLLRQEAPAPV